MARLPSVLRSSTSVASPRVVGLVSVGHGTNEFASVVIPPIIPLLVADIGITYAEAGMLLTVFYVMYSLLQLPVGVSADWIGPKRLLVAGFAATSAGIVIASVATSFPELVLAQVVAGAGGSTFHPTGLSLLSDVETESTEGRAMGVFGLGGVIGTMASPVLVGGVAAIAGWRAALGTGALLAALVTVLFVFGFRVPDDGSEESTAETDGPGPSLRDPLGSIRELVRIPHTTDVWLLVVLTGVLALLIRAIQTFTTSYVAEATNGTTSVGNLSFFALLFGGAVTSLGAGALADRFDRGRLGGLMALGTATFIGATVFVTDVLAVLSPNVQFVAMAVWFFAIGLTMYATVPISNAMISQRSSSEFSGSLFGVTQTVSAAGSAIGPSAFGVVASDFGIVAAFPLITLAGAALAVLFFLTSRAMRTGEDSAGEGAAA